MGLKRQIFAFTVGVLLAAAAGFTIPMLGLAALGFVPLSAGLIFASFYLIDDGEEATSGDPASTHRRR